MLAPWLSGCRALGSCRHASLNAWVKDKHLSIFVKFILKKKTLEPVVPTPLFYN